MHLMKTVLVLLLILLSMLPNILAEPSGPQHIITFAPNITHSVIALGAGARIVGVTDFCVLPPQLQAVRRCGGWLNPNFEVIQALQPDLVIFHGQNVKLKSFCHERHIATLSLYMDSLASIQKGLRLLGERLGVADAAQRLCQQIDQAVARARQHQWPYRPRVFVVIARRGTTLNGLLSTGRGTFIDELITLAGGRNIFGDLHTPYPQISKESLLQRAPEIILEICPGQALTPQAQARRRAAWQLLPSLPAVRQKRIYFVNDPQALLAGPHVIKLLHELQTLLHPTN